jgi:hypothetical protein
MKIATTRKVMIMLVGLLISSYVFAQASAIPASRLINPEDLVKLLQAGSEYAGAASTEAGLKQLRERVQSLPRNKFIVLYCGCCPWSHCPNVKPADDALSTMGFTNVKVLYIADNFGANWVDKGYPTAKGE